MEPAAKSRRQRTFQAGGCSPVLRKPYPRLVAEKLKGDRWRRSLVPGAI